MVVVIMMVVVEVAVVVVMMMMMMMVVVVVVVVVIDIEKRERYKKITPNENMKNQFKMKAKIKASHLIVENFPSVTERTKSFAPT